MPLDLPSLVSGLESVAADPPDTAAEAAQEWADAMEAFALAVIPPSTTVTTAAATLSTALAAAFGAPPSSAAMEIAFAAFAVTVGGGMAGFTAVPPPLPVGFASQFTPPFPPSHIVAATEIGNIIDTWMRTGTATAIPPPVVPPIPWS